MGNIAVKINRQALDESIFIDSIELAKRTPSQLQELIEWRQERSDFWTGFAKQTKGIALQLRRLAYAKEHAKQATILINLKNTN